MVDLTELTIKQAHEGLKNKEFTSVDLTKAYLEKIKNTDFLCAIKNTWQTNANFLWNYLAIVRSFTGVEAENFFISIIAFSASCFLS